jgi:hypothetical protein
VVVGGGILILLIRAFIQGSLSPGWFLHALGGSFSNAIAAAAAMIYKTMASTSELFFN